MTSHKFEMLDISEYGVLRLTSGMSKQDEQLEDGSFIHKISFELPERFVINNNFKIELVDLNYQNVGDKVLYHVQKPMTEIRYNINFSTTMPQTSND